MANEAPQAARAPRGWFLTVMAILFVVLAISDCTKALQFARHPALLGLVVFGHRFQGVALNLMLGPLLGAVLLAYAHGIWHLRRWVLPLSIVYAFYVPYNLVLFWYEQPPGPRPIAPLVAYLAIALTGSIGTAICLAYHRERLS